MLIRGYNIGKELRKDGSAVKASELVDALKKYPPDTRVMLYDEKKGSYLDPELKILEVIAVTEWGSEKICDVSRKWEYDGCRQFSILTLQ